MFPKAIFSAVVVPNDLCGARCRLGGSFEIKLVDFETFFFACMMVKPESRAFGIRNICQHVTGPNRYFPVLDIFGVNEIVFIDYPLFDQQHRASEPIKIRTGK